MAYYDIGVSIYLGKLLGLYFLITGVWWLCNREAIPAIINKAFKNQMLVLLTGVIALVAGLAIILAHNVWEWGLPLLVTLTGWISLLKGIMRLFVRPASEGEYTKKMTQGVGALITFIFIFGFGVGLTYYGFAHSY